MDATVLIAVSVLIAYLLDLWLGDPTWLPHPIIAFGNSIAWFEKQLNRPKRQKLKGGLMVIVLTGLTFLTFYGLKIVSKSNIWFYAVYTTIFTFLGLANKTLITEVKAVFDVLSNKGLDAGRQQVSRLVGRDTSQLSEHQIKTAALETLSENLSDGVVAPLFYFAIGGVPAMMTYKMINTMDSMVGYKNERYKNFGFFAAKLDDMANYVPARLTALLMTLVTWHKKGLKYMIKYGPQHSSPNAGYPEATLAGILDCQFGGPNKYHGQMVDKPYIGTNARALTHRDMIRAIRINHNVCLLSIIIVIIKIMSC